MLRERIESLAASGLLLLGCASCWLLLAAAARVEARSAERVEQLQQFEDLRDARHCGAPGRLPGFDGLFGDRAVCRAETRFGGIFTVELTGQVP